LVYDDNGSHQAVSTAEFMAKRGAKVELASPERTVGIEIGATNYPIHQREMYGSDVIFSPDLRLRRIYGEDNRLVAVLRNEYSLREEERVVDQIVAEHGTLPNEALYFALKPHSTNLGELDHRAIRANQPQAIVSNPAGKFQLFRVGDAIASRNIHAAIYDSRGCAKRP
jgi:hypothetical protein